MELSESRAILRQHWAFWLFNRFEHIPYPLIALALSLGIYGIGAILALLVGDPLTYFKSIPAYLFLAGLTLALMAHGWWVRAMCSLVVCLYPAFEMTLEEFKTLLVQWNQSRLNQAQFIALAGLPFALTNLRDTILIWKSVDPGSVFSPWVHSSRSLFFALWYGLLHVGVTSFVLGSGVLGIIATMWLIHTIMQKPLRLGLHRQLEAASALGVGLAFWSFIALAAIALFTRPLLSNATSYPLTFRAILQAPGALQLDPLFISTLLQTALGAIALISAFFPPLLIARNATRHAKLALRLKLQYVVDRIYADLKKLAEKAALPSASASETAKSELASQWEALQKELTAANAMLKEVASIPAWPVSVLSFTQLLGGALLPILSSKLGSLIFPGK